MRRLIVFNHMSLDGYFTDAQGDMSFARNDNPDAEWDAFVAGNKEKLPLKLTKTRTFDNGNVLLCYEPRV
jgi:hypothetical protein